ncbi:MAG: tetratricopeptide repeat protein [Candidatus Brocadiia bacterium]
MDGAASTRGIFALAALAVAGAVARPAACGQKMELEFVEPCPALEVVAERAELRLGGTTLEHLAKGQRYSATAKRGSRYQVHVFSGKVIRHGWVDAGDVRELAEDEVDLAAEALRIAARLKPGIDVAACRARLDALTRRVAEVASGADSPRGRVRAISGELFREERFRLRPGVRTLEAVLEERGGNCLGLSLLTLCAARRAGLPVCLVAVPRHVFVRWEGDGGAMNIEPTLGGRVVSDATVARAHCPPGGAKPRKLSSLQVVGVLLTEAGVALHKKGEDEAACRLLAQAVALAPRHGELYHNWGNALVALGQYPPACDRFSRAIRCDPRNAAAFYTWGVALASMGELRWACQKYESAVEIAPRSAGAFYNWGLTLLRMGREGEGVEKLRRAAALSPRFKAKVEKLLEAVQR